MESVPRPASGLRRPGLLTPERVFAALALPFGLAFALVMAPNDPPDEIRHLARIYLLTEGHWNVYGRSPGYDYTIPRSLVEVHPLHGDRRIHHHPNQQLEALDRPVEPTQRTRLKRAALYSPLAYAPQALG
ncbi:MAG: DUF2142 domain-containing protein, partial [Proteobacteria bacterium]|nr:DUF2142 domain-containing protein [Pseudomonadota bacterium]